MFQGVQLPFYSSLDKNGENLHRSSSPFSMMVATGPFTTSDSLLYEPLTDLISIVQRDKPDLLILVSKKRSCCSGFCAIKYAKQASGNTREKWLRMCAY
jgi:hypothetical protein